MCDTPSHGSDHLWLIWKESIQNYSYYRADTAGGTDGRTDRRTDGVKPIYPHPPTPPPTPPPPPHPHPPSPTPPPPPPHPHPHPPPPPPTTSLFGGITTFTRYCLTQWISKLRKSFEIHWVGQYLTNFTDLACIANITVYKTEPVFTGLGHGNLSQFLTLMMMCLFFFFFFFFFYLQNQFPGNGESQWSKSKGHWYQNMI